jgi:hypothetical protein
VIIIRNWGICDNELRFLIRVYVNESSVVCAASVWSSGMIPALGAGGPGFNPPNRPVHMNNFAAVKHSCSLIFQFYYSHLVKIHQSERVFLFHN